MESSCASPGSTGMPAPGPAYHPPQLQILDFIFPGFSILSEPLQRYFHVDLNIYIPLLLLLGGATFAWRYFSETIWNELESHFMSTVDIRCDDEIYNMLMAWVAAQTFSKRARRFVANTNLSSRNWFVYQWDRDDDDDDDEGDSSTDHRAKKKALNYTPTFGSHYFWYKGRLLIFRRTQNRDNSLFRSEKEEISVSCFGRNPAVLKELLLEARADYMKRDEKKTLIYRSATTAASSEPTWQRCMARDSRPFSTVILNDQVKKDLITDVTDYLDANTRRWYSNRGIPYRRGYLLYGPPGTGKSSLSLALAGFFKMRIYIVSLSSVNANEENLSALFAELPRRCVVLLEDIDTAGLTHTRENNTVVVEPPAADKSTRTPVPLPQVSTNKTEFSSRLSLSGLLNILDGVASQEGRVLIMTTNHLEKLDKALIRPGRVDIIVKFDLADRGMVAAIFRAIFAPHEADSAPAPEAKDFSDAEAIKQLAHDEAEKRQVLTKRVEKLAEEFADKIPAHEFSPAELQGYLLKNKREPDVCVAGAEQWVIETRKEKKEKELKEAEEKRQEEEKKRKEEEEEKKKKEKEERKMARKEAKKKEKALAKEEAKKRKSKKDGVDSKASEADEDSSDVSSSESESEADAGTTRKVSEGSHKTELAPEKGKDGKEHGVDSGYGSPS